MFRTRPRSCPQPRDVKVEPHALRLLCNLLMPQVTPQSRKCALQPRNLTAEHQLKSFTRENRNLKVHCGHLGKFIDSFRLPRSARAGLVHKENLSAHGLGGCRTALLTMPQRHETDGAVLLGFKISPCSGDPMKRINPGTE